MPDLLPFPIYTGNENMTSNQIHTPLSSNYKNTKHLMHLFYCDPVHNIFHKSIKSVPIIPLLK